MIQDSNSGTPSGTRLDAVQLGRNSGLRVSRLTLGTMNFGEPGRGHQGDWTLDADAARPIFEAAIEKGLFTFDCADIYGLGASEEVVGKLLRELLPRDQYVITTKVSFPMSRGANAGGLSRKHIFEGIDASLRRLGLDYVDQLIIHRHPHGDPGGGTASDRGDHGKRCTTWSRRVRRCAWARRRCSPGSSPTCSGARVTTAGRRSCRCRTTTTSSIAKRSGR